jgi:crossover junction endodeoxyribonuclease RuvC
MRIIGIDPALAITGYGIIDCCKNRVSLLKAGAVITRYRQRLPERLNIIYEKVRALISEYKPDVLVLEKVYVHYHHQTTAFLLGQARGIICLACAKGNIPLKEYAATQIKKAIVGKGQASKEQVQQMVLRTLKLKAIPRYHDVTDALALALAYSYFEKADSLIKQGSQKA